MPYDHTQTAPLWLLLLIGGVAMLVGAWLTPMLLVQAVLLCGGGLMGLLACCFRQLIVRDEGETLLIRFGPLPVFKRRVRYSDIDRVERSRTTILDGWGIHLSPGGGWTWNLWGFDCVDVYFKNKNSCRLRIGTNDSEALEAFLKQRTTNGSSPSAGRDSRQAQRA